MNMGLGCCIAWAPHSSPHGDEPSLSVRRGGGKGVCGMDAAPPPEVLENPARPAARAAIGNALLRPVQCLSVAR